MSYGLANPSRSSDDALARDLLGAAGFFTGQITALAARLRTSRPELADHLNQLAAEVAGAVLEAVRTWPVSGNRRAGCWTD